MGDGAGDFSDIRAAAVAFRRRQAYQRLRKKLRAAKRWVPNLWRQWTQAYRQLPGAIIAGAQKAGTTQLFVALTQHPRCLGGIAKELQYFSKRADLPLSWYRSRFPLRRQVERVRGVCIEATPSYLPTPTAIELMRQTLPDAKIIVLLRDPVARAYSHYQHYKSRSQETRTFDEIVQAAIAGPLTPAGLRAESPFSLPPMTDYISRGYYAVQLGVLFHAYPRNQVLVMDSAELFADTNGACQTVFEFLGLEPFEIVSKKIYNRGYYREKIAPVLEAALRHHYQPHDDLLAELLGRQFSWMEPRAERSTAA